MINLYQDIRLGLRLGGRREEFVYLGRVFAAQVGYLAVLSGLFGPGEPQALVSRVELGALVTDSRQAPVGIIVCHAGGNVKKAPGSRSLGAVEAHNAVFQGCYS